MTAYRKLAAAAFAIALLAAMPSNAHAQLLDEKVHVTFSAPVEVPGRVLPEGTYVFVAIGPNHLTRILSEDEQTIYGTFLTAPQERLEAPEKATVILGENTQGGPERVEAWFYPGDSIGSEFMYPEPSSHHKLTSALADVGKGIDTAVLDAGKGALDSGEFVGRCGERIVVNSGKAVGHAAKYLVS
jgi:hypothetical protein